MDSKILFIIIALILAAGAFFWKLIATRRGSQSKLKGSDFFNAVSLGERQSRKNNY